MGFDRCHYQLLRSYKRHEENKRKIGQERSSMQQADYQCHRPTPWMQESVSMHKSPTPVRHSRMNQERSEEEEKEKKRDRSQEADGKKGSPPPPPQKKKNKSKELKQVLQRHSSLKQSWGIYKKIMHSVAQSKWKTPKADINFFLQPNPKFETKINKISQKLTRICNQYYCAVVYILIIYVAIFCHEINCSWNDVP